MKLKFKKLLIILFIGCVVNGINADTCASYEDDNPCPSYEEIEIYV